MFSSAKTWYRQRGRILSSGLFTIDADLSLFGRYEDDKGPRRLSSAETVPSKKSRSSKGW